MDGVQTVRCKCGCVFAACIEPECYMDKQWMKDLRRYVKKGNTVKVVPKDEFEFGKCTCDTEIGIFDKI